MIDVKPVPASFSRSQLYGLGQKLPFVTDNEATSLAEDLAIRLSREMRDWCEQMLPEGWPRFGAFEKYYCVDTPYASEDHESRIEIFQRSLLKDLDLSRAPRRLVFVF